MRERQDQYHACQDQKAPIKAANGTVTRAKVMPARTPTSPFSKSKQARERTTNIDAKIAAIML
ncbi:hypothetical protein KDH_57040 [Dictyobacter sp. S3.2.2.5]|uniref:Uncharacterized protein n=1 Tax=Dictyobacter halimunensis TaxID=3026934 RepID=A0ABQ6FYQ8_9CHLR|nr:hypothetical protein KDH_57040 [Dictyobacter sp. S3.2.2.5]